MDKNLTDSVKKRNPLVRIGVLCLVCCVIAFLALILSFAIWATVSFQHTVSSLQGRVEMLEKECSHSVYNKQELHELINSKVEELLKQKLKTEITKRDIGQRFPRELCQCPQ
ncbi:hypothetical protein ACJMK2_033495, partial [Sinanodonta woodiana]